MANKNRRNGGKLLFTFVAGVVTGTLTSYFSKKENREDVVTKYNDSKQTFKDKVDEIKEDLIEQIKDKNDKTSPIIKKGTSSKTKTN